MSGLINNAKPQQPPESGITNPLLAASLRQLEAQFVDKLAKQNFDKIVLAGMHIALEGGPNGIMASLKDSRDPVRDCALGAVNLVMMMRKRASGTMPDKVVPAAAMALMLHALDFADRAGIAKIGNPELVRASHLFTDRLFQAYGITKQMLARGAGHVSRVMQDPEAMQKVRYKAGADPMPGTGKAQ